MLLDRGGASGYQPVHLIRDRVSGQQIQVKGSYEDVTLTLKARNLSETGTRELTKTDGTKFTVALGMIGLVEEIGETTRTRIGFWTEG